MSRADNTDRSRSRGQFEKLVRSTPETNMTPLLSRDDIIDGIKEIADTLRDRGVTGTLQLVGGAAIVLTVNAHRRLTRDVDATLAPKDEIERAARIVAERRHWPADWLNDDAAQFLPSGFGRPAEWTTLYQDTTITIQAATHETLLAMKLHAAARRGAREAEDIADLFDRVGIASVNAAEAALRRVLSRRRAHAEDRPNRREHPRRNARQHPRTPAGQLHLTIGHAEPQGSCRLRSRTSPA